LSPLPQDEFYELSKVLFGTRRKWRESLPWVIGSGEARRRRLRCRGRESTWLESTACTRRPIPHPVACAPPTSPPETPALVLQLIVFPYAARWIISVAQARSSGGLYLPEAPLAALVGMLYHFIAKRA
jgi:hypothetical protein